MGSHDEKYRKSIEYKASHVYWIEWYRHNRYTLIFRLPCTAILYRCHFFCIGLKRNLMPSLSFVWIISIAAYNVCIAANFLLMFYNCYDAERCLHTEQERKGQWTARDKEAQKYSSARAHTHTQANIHTATQTSQLTISNELPLPIKSNIYYLYMARIYLFILLLWNAIAKWNEKSSKALWSSRALGIHFES